MSAPLSPPRVEKQSSLKQIPSPFKVLTFDFESNTLTHKNHRVYKLTIYFNKNRTLEYTSLKKSKVIEVIKKASSSTKGADETQRETWDSSIITEFIKYQEKAVRKCEEIGGGSKENWYAVHFFDFIIIQDVDGRKKFEAFLSALFEDLRVLEDNKLFIIIGNGGAGKHGMIEFMAQQQELKETVVAWSFDHSGPNFKYAKTLHYGITYEPHLENHLKQQKQIQTPLAFFVNNLALISPRTDILGIKETLKWHEQTYWSKLNVFNQDANYKLQKFGMPFIHRFCEDLWKTSYLSRRGVSKNVLKKLISKWEGVYITRYNHSAIGENDRMMFVLGTYQLLNYLYFLKSNSTSVRNLTHEIPETQEKYDDIPGLDFDILMNMFMIWDLGNTSLIVDRIMDHWESTCMIRNQTYFPPNVRDYSFEKDKYHLNDVAFIAEYKEKNDDFKDEDRLVGYDLQKPNSHYINNYAQIWSPTNYDRGDKLSEQLKNNVWVNTFINKFNNLKCGKMCARVKTQLNIYRNPRDDETFENLSKRYNNAYGKASHLLGKYFVNEWLSNNLEEVGMLSTSFIAKDDLSAKDGVRYKYSVQGCLGHQWQVIKIDQTNVPKHEKLEVKEFVSLLTFLNKKFQGYSSNYMTEFIGEIITISDEDARLSSDEDANEELDEIWWKDVPTKKEGTIFILELSGYNSVGLKYLGKNTKPCYQTINDQTFDTTTRRDLCKDTYVPTTVRFLKNKIKNDDELREHFKKDIESFNKKESLKKKELVETLCSFYDQKYVQK